MNARTRGAWTGFVLAASMVAGCAADVAPATPPPSSDPGVKAGAKPGPITMTVVDSQPPGTPSNLPLSAFERVVESSSQGSMEVTVRPHTAAKPSAPASDGEVIEGVRSGAFELAVVPARAWSAAGVTSLKALQAPMLLESDELVAAVVTDEGLSAKLLGGIGGAVTGLVLFPEGLRHLFGFGEPIRAPGDLAGAGIRMIRSAETDAIITALGGVPLEASDDAFTRGVEDGTIRGAESSYALVASMPGVPIATGNVVLYAKVDTLVVNTRFWAGLTDAQRMIVKEAAVATRDQAIRSVPDDATAAANYCASGGTVVNADEASIEAFRSVLDGVAAALAKDPATDELMTAIRGVTTGDATRPVDDCEPSIALTIHPDGGDLPDGIYRVEYTDAYLRGWGVVDVNDQHGVWTYRLDGGRWAFDQQSDDTVDHDEGIYQVKGGDLYWRWDEDAGQPIEHLTWSAAPNGDLTFTAAPGGTPGWTFGLSLIRAGPLD